MKGNDLSVGTIIKRAAVEIHETKYKHGHEVIVSEKNMMAYGSRFQFERVYDSGSNVLAI